MQLRKPGARFYQSLLVIGLLAGYFVLAVTATLRKCTTYDEIAHLTAGYSFWRFNDYRLLGNWPQRWAALPLLWTEPAFPSDQAPWFQSHVWETGKRFFYYSGNEPDSLLLQGRVMIALLGVVLGALVFWYARRLFGTLAGFLALGLYVICPTLLANGALITADLPAALLFLASLPALWWMLHEITPRSLVVCGLVLGGLFLTKYSAVIMVPVAGLLLLLRLADGRPLPVHLGTVRRMITKRLHMLAAFTAGFLAIGAMIWGLIWISYGCRYEALNKPVPGRERLRPGWVEVYNDLNFPETTTAQMILWMNDRHLLPESYLYFFAYTLRTSMQREAFLNGDYSINGFRGFFPYCLLVKTPLGTFAVLLIAGLSVTTLWRLGAWRETWRGFYMAAPLWIFLAVYWTTAVMSHINIGHRHLLPTYPVMFVLAGAAARFWPGGGSSTSRAVSDIGKLGNLPPRFASGSVYPLQARILCGLLLLTAWGWAAFDSLRSWPNFLTYFNQIVGGPSEGYRHLVDSSLDWGQDLPDLKRWINDHDPYRKEQIYLYYFGTGPFYPPELPILHARRPPRGFVGRPSLDVPPFQPLFSRFGAALHVPPIGLLGSPVGFGPLLAGSASILQYSEYPELPNTIPDSLEPGIYCISATYLQGVYVKPFGGPWNAEYEKRYQKNMTFRWHYDHRDEPRSRMVLNCFEEHDARAARKEDTWRAGFVASYHELCFARLLKYLREQRQPDDQVNHSILIYRVTKDDLDEAFRPLVLEE